MVISVRNPDVDVEFTTTRNIDPVPASRRLAQVADPGFGRYFTDHMVTLRWTTERGWHEGRLEPYAPLSLDPSTATFHYAQEFFEGLKAYRQEDGGTALFRPELNAARFNRTAHRLAMPEIPESVFLRMLEMLVREDADWVPAGDGNSLYLRPFMIATQPGLGFTLPSDRYLLCAIASPSSYLGGRVPEPLTVWIADAHVRASPGGTGSVKAACNYAPAFAVQQIARDNDCDQVVWLDAVERLWVEEMGGMNLFFVYGGHDGTPPRLITPALTGTLLPGVTRRSLLELAPTLDMGVEEGRISVAEWRRDCERGLITEVFACGTAATVIPVGTVRGVDATWQVGDGRPGPTTLQLRQALMDIQYGRGADPFGWSHRVF